MSWPQLGKSANNPKKQLVISTILIPYNSVCLRRGFKIIMFQNLSKFQWLVKTTVIMIVMIPELISWTFSTLLKRRVGLQWILSCTSTKFCLFAGSRISWPVSTHSHILYIYIYIHLGTEKKIRAPILICIYKYIYMIINIEIWMYDRTTGVINHWLPSIAINNHECTWNTLNDHPQIARGSSSSRWLPNS